MLTPTATSSAPAAIGPYSQAIRFGDTLYTSGQIALDAASGEMVGADIAAQAEQCLKNLAAILKANGVGLDRVIKTTCFLSDMADFAAFNEVYARHFGDHKPARSCFAVKALPKNALCEVEAIVALA